ncbi:hypothetical protein PLESTF_001217400 [Pleodorina starrii]|nr:hypothetical protein PLESTF_001217400 [Pleodorina starrii]
MPHPLPTDSTEQHAFVEMKIDVSKVASQDPQMKEKETTAVRRHPGCNQANGQQQQQQPANAAAGAKAFVSSAGGADGSEGIGDVRERAAAGGGAEEGPDGESDDHADREEEAAGDGEGGGTEECDGVEDLAKQPQQIPGPTRGDRNAAGAGGAKRSRQQEEELHTPVGSREQQQPPMPSSPSEPKRRRGAEDTAGRAGDVAEARGAGTHANTDAHLLHLLASIAGLPEGAACDNTPPPGPCSGVGAAPPGGARRTATAATTTTATANTNSGGAAAGTAAPTMAAANVAGGSAGPGVKKKQGTTAKGRTPRGVAVAGAGDDPANGASAGGDVSKSDRTAKERQRLVSNFADHLKEPSDEGRRIPKPSAKFAGANTVRKGRQAANGPAASPSPPPAPQVQAQAQAHVQTQVQGPDWEPRLDERMYTPGGLRTAAALIALIAAAFRDEMKRLMGVEAALDAAAQAVRARDEKRAAATKAWMDTCSASARLDRVFEQHRASLSKDKANALAAVAPPKDAQTYILGIDRASATVQEYQEQLARGDVTFTLEDVRRVHPSLVEPAEAFLVQRAAALKLKAEAEAAAGAVEQLQPDAQAREARFTRLTRVGEAQVAALRARGVADPVQELRTLLAWSRGCLRRLSEGQRLEAAEAAAAAAEAAEAVGATAAAAVESPLMSDLHRLKDHFWSVYGSGQLQQPGNEDARAFAKELADYLFRFP